MSDPLTATPEPLPEDGPAEGPAPRGSRGWLIPALAAGAVVAVVAAVAASAWVRALGDCARSPLAARPPTVPRCRPRPNCARPPRTSWTPPCPRGRAKRRCAASRGPPPSPPPSPGWPQRSGLGRCRHARSGRWEARRPWRFPAGARRARPALVLPAGRPPRPPRRLPGHPGDIRPRGGPGRLQRALHRSAGVGPAGIGLGVGHRGLCWCGRGDRRRRGPGSEPRRRRDGPPVPEPAPGTDPGWQPYPEPVPVPEPSPGPSADSARATAAPVLAAVGLDAAAARVEPGAPDDLGQPRSGGRRPAHDRVGHLGDRGRRGHRLRRRAPGNP